MKSLTLCICILVLVSATINAQLFFKYNTDPDNRISVSNDEKAPLPYPWAGGMNSCQFGEVDMNLDGIKDLFVFDRMGDRIMTFINGGQPNISDYSYAPEFISAFPDLYDWVILKDYNNDGKADIFTYAKEFPGIIVYQNVSSSQFEFELVVYPFLTSFQGGGQVNILTTDVDYPGIDDIDNDGDMDILTFWGLGSFVEYHQNQSMELYGIPDSLEFIEVTQCWGRFAENDESNVIYLDTCMGGSKSIASTGIQEDSRHTGSTFLLLDLDGDLDKDLLLGDVDYPNPIQLINGGDPDSAIMISQDPDFPSYNKPVNLFSMPASAYIDINNNGIKDLILSPFDPSPVTSANYRSVWMYNNIGENNNPDFDFVQNNFIQEGMIDVGSGAYPVLADYNGDGLSDLFVSNYGYYKYSFYEPGQLLSSVYWSGIALFENIGTSFNSHFSLATQNFAGIQEMHLTGVFPTFGDLDDDGDVDMIAGRDNGTIMFFENIAGQGNPMDFADPITDFQGIDVGDYSTPQLYDLDGDGLNDLTIGEQAGNLNYYRNTGSSTSPEFTMITDSLGKVNVTNYNLSYNGYSTPCFFKNLGNGTQLLVGSEQGKVFYYKNIEGNLEGVFDENDSIFLLLGNQSMEFDMAMRTGVAIGELNDDGLYDLLVGNYSGGLHYYSGAQSPSVSHTNENPQNSISANIFPNPVHNHFTLVTNHKLERTDITVYDLYGIQYKKGQYGPGTAFDVNISDLPQGVYIVKLSSVSNCFESQSIRVVKTK